MYRLAIGVEVLAAEVGVKITKRNNSSSYPLNNNQPIYQGQSTNIKSNSFEEFVYLRVFNSLWFKRQIVCFGCFYSFVCETTVSLLRNSTRLT